MSYSTQRRQQAQYQHSYHGKTVIGTQIEPEALAFSSRKFCPICMLRLYNYIISWRLKSFVLLNDKPRFFCRRASILYLAPLAVILPAFRFFYADKNYYHTGHIPNRQVYPPLDILACFWPVIPDA